MSDKPVIFFDGVCVLCNGFADFILKWDKKKFFYLAPLQGAHAKKALHQKYYTDLDSIIYLKGKKVHTKSDAILNILLDLGGFWEICLILFVFPKFLRDFIYRHIANKRYKWFGEKDLCRIPLPHEKNRFLA